MTARPSTARALGWGGAGQVGSRLLHFGAIAVLAALLSPADFGVLGLAMAYVFVVEGLGVAGLSSALIRIEEITPDDEATAFWLNLGVGVGLGVATAAAAAPISRVLGDPALTEPLRALALFLPLSFVGSVPRALVERKLDFATVARAQVFGEVLFAGCAIPLAIVLGSEGAGVWALVAGVLAQRAGVVGWVWWRSGWLPRGRLRLARADTLLGFGSGVAVSNLLHRLVGQADYLGIGRLLGTEALGFYTVAFQFAVLPFQRLVDVFQRVLFPALARVVGDLDRGADGRGAAGPLFVRSTEVLSVLAVPGLLALLLGGAEGLELVYGERWRGAALPLSILSIAGGFYLLDVSQAAWYALGRPFARVAVLLLRLALFLCLATVGGFGGSLDGLAWAMTVAVGISAVVGWATLVGPLDMSSSALLGSPQTAVRAGLGGLVAGTLFEVVVTGGLGRGFGVGVGATWVEMTAIGLGAAAGFLLLLPRGWARRAGEGLAA